MNKRVKLSIHIITYNRPEEVKRAVESCLPLPENNYEIIIWDNHSTEENTQAVREYCETSPLNIHFYASEKNLGVGGGRDATYQRSNGEYIFVLDDDAVVKSPHFFDDMISYMDAHPQVAVVYPNIFEPATGKMYDCEYQYQNNAGQTESFTYLGGAHLLRADAVKRKNLYPTGSVFGGEEMYASVLFWNDGYEVHRMNDLWVHHLPASINRHLGKERDKLFIIASYSVKNLLFPRTLVPMEFCLFLLHLAKNGFHYDKQCRSIIKATYKKEEAIRIRFRTLFKIIKKFGLKPLI